LWDKKKGVILQPVFDRNLSKGKKFFDKIEDSQEVANAPK
jgi:hypothetical protein